MVNVGLVTCSVTPRARQAPRTKVVFPAPISPRTSTTSPARSPAASSAASASVSWADAVTLALAPLIGRAQAQTDSAEQEGQPDQRDGARVATRAGQLGGRRAVLGAGRGRAGRHSRGPGRAQV